MKAVADHDQKVIVRRVIVHQAIDLAVKAKATVLSDHQLKNKFRS